MTLPSATAKVQYEGDGATLVFAFPHLFLADADLIVILTTESTGVHAVQTLTTHYTVQNAGNATTGQVTFVTEPTTDERVTIARNMTLTQAVDYVADANFQAETHEEALDRMEMKIQELADGVKRCLRVGEGELLAWDGEIGGIDARKSKLVGFDASGDLSMETTPFALETNQIVLDYGNIYVKFLVDAPNNKMQIWLGESAATNSLWMTFFY